MSYQQRDRLILLKRELHRFDEDHTNVITPSQGMWGVTIQLLNNLLGGEDTRKRFLKWAFDVDSSKDLKGWQKFSLVVWVAPNKKDDLWRASDIAKSDCHILKLKL